MAATTSTPRPVLGSAETDQSAETAQARPLLQQVVDGALGAPAAASQIANIYEPSLRAGDARSIERLWAIILKAGVDVGTNEVPSRRLVDLLNSLSQLPDILNARDARPEPSWASEGKYWSNLPGLAFMYRVQVMDLDRHRFVSGKTSLLDATYFAAMWLGHGLPHNNIGMYFHAETGLMTALEYHDAERAELYVPAAAVWIANAGQKIHSLCVEKFDEDSDGPGLPDHGPWLWNKGRGFSPQRWAFWKQRFAQIAEGSDSDSHVRGVAAKARDQMEAVEGRS